MIYVYKDCSGYGVENVEGEGGTVLAIESPIRKLLQIMVI